MLTPSESYASQNESFDMSRIFERQSARALTLRTSTARERIAKLRLLMEATLKYRDEILSAAQADFRKPPAETELTEVFPVIAEARHAIRHLKKWMKPKYVAPTRAMLGTRAEVRFEPKGVCLIISPWNYPVTLTLSPLISAIAAGNTAMIKPSEITPHMSAITRRIIEEVFDEDEVAVFEGDYRVSQQLLELPFNHIFFTGSPAVGKIVMSAAAKHLASVTLELGGKSPTIVDNTADLKVAARNIVWGKFSNNGQTCIAPDYVLVHEAIKDAFLQELTATIERVYGETVQKRAQSADYCRIVNKRHLDRLKKLYDAALDNGARTLTGGEFRADELFIDPTVIDGVTDASPIMQEEIFGPLLPVLEYSDLSDAIDYVNRQEKPLALYIFSKDKDNIRSALDNTAAGDSSVNHCLIHYLHLNAPFGGVNNSGIGKSTGHAGFKSFSHERSVVSDRFSVFHWLYPPYTGKVRRLIKLSIDYLT
ncbi:MAG: aldehyde dehydrogenase family protein [Gammaproteobacteria bacterium]|nr:aldehyde dehydrogenase family protein [Gammaproteobacteria bacterium]